MLSAVEAVFWNRPEAQGEVHLPRGKKFGLLLSRGTTDLSCLRDMPKLGLEALYCNMLDWTDDAVAQVTALEGLKTFYLSAPNVTDGTLAAVARMSTLEELSLSAKSVTNEGLRKLAPLNLKRLSLYGIKNEETGTGPVCGNRRGRLSCPRQGPSHSGHP